MCEIMIIHSLLGTPTLDVWPGLAQMPDFRPQFPKWRAQNLADVVSELDQQGIHLLSRMLVYEPQRRLSGERLQNCARVAEKIVSTTDVLGRLASRSLIHSISQSRAPPSVLHDRCHNLDESSPIRWSQSQLIVVCAKQSPWCTCGAECASKSERTHGKSDQLSLKHVSHVTRMDIVSPLLAPPHRDLRYLSRDSWGCFTCHDASATTFYSCVPIEASL